MAPVYKIALCQFNPKVAKVAENFALAESYLRLAADKGCHLAVLPEFHLTSWEPSHPDFIAAMKESMSCLAKYQALARELDINIIPGTLCESYTGERGEEELKNVAYFLAAGTGDICGSYQKKNLWHPERPYLTPGRDLHLAFGTPLKDINGKSLRAGLLIYWDLTFPEGFRALVQDGADLIIIPAYWSTAGGEDIRQLNGDAETVFLDSVLTARAFENNAVVVFCNAGGLIRVILPILGSLGSIPPGEDKVEVFDVDLVVLWVAEERYKIRKDMQSLEWQYK
ncbi:hypothetical protein FOQG_14686 [Fusarium oxysporum f. sp. raphani 54005]|uniref:CN hydrolase domain-containing protein n=2 Tax=Fusarium oxysporum f. sp. raphani TaxID=96318 RepID=X0BG92_FUSOX|nr:hypothetical protein FOQG_14686 [Fusarium oxysporum f. sp. raphani 54005]